MFLFYPVSSFAIISICHYVDAIGATTTIINKTATVGDSFNFTCYPSEYCLRPASICWGVEWTVRKKSFNDSHDVEVEDCPNSSICFHHPFFNDGSSVKPWSLMVFRNVTSTSEGEYKCTEYIDRYPEPSGVSLQVLLSLTVKTSHNITNSETGRKHETTTTAASRTGLGVYGTSSSISKISWLTTTAKDSSSTSGDNRVTITTIAVTLSTLLAFIFTICVVYCLCKKAECLFQREESEDSWSATNVICRVYNKYWEDWEFQRDRLVVHNEFAHGMFGTIYRGDAYGIALPKTWSTVAVKMSTRDKDDSVSSNEAILRAEAQLFVVMGDSRHENVVRLLGICSGEGPLCLIFEYARHGDLKSYLRSHRESESCEEDCTNNTSNSKETKTLLITAHKMFSFAIQIASAMEYLCDKQIVHCDLAARNVLVFEEEVLKVCDFGMARNVKSYGYYRRQSKGLLPLKWMSPECIMYKCYTQASDVWSFGVLLWEIATLGGSPYPSVPTQRLYDILTSGYRMNCPTSCPRRLHAIMLLCWTDNPSQRPTFEDLSGQLSDAMKRI
ncbi:fibroblast growth factor receptor 4-like isoform X2 [Corticium candelabrum]|nr:fibroblast growth factor receptor 4-like isoform X2 [Corticium candelabrum]XP_062512195.1 fibroblast growth factor receptor 4-like isoform X2 [Corticium candelabrum]XP_062512196.1 fibroblast growth factor receptor 4-like isoform X2 [Corticium candelabrum]XP_062512197.1 fibroblast growth factor receptor 4-like isoform X2 [Corticium candelabrum]